MLIGGEWVDAASGERIEVENPSRREVIGSVPRGAAADVDRAVAAATAAFDRGGAPRRATAGCSWRGSRRTWQGSERSWRG